MLLTDPMLVNSHAAKAFKGKVPARSGMVHGADGRNITTFELVFRNVTSNERGLHAPLESRWSFLNHVVTGATELGPDRLRPVLSFKG